VERQGPAERPGAAVPLEPTRPVSRQLPKDEVVAIGGGGRVTVPSRWHVTEHAGTGHVVLEEPDRELWMALCST
jgi:hypothetical protein